VLAVLEPALLEVEELSLVDLLSGFAGAAGEDALEAERLSVL
jgi:hypothetical protein